MIMQDQEQEEEEEEVELSFEKVNGIKGTTISNFANSIIQCLFNIKSFFDLITKNDDDLPLKEFLIQYYTSSDEVNPKKFYMLNDLLNNKKKCTIDDFLRKIALIYPSINKIIEMEIEEFGDEGFTNKSFSYITIPQEYDINDGIKKKMIEFSVVKTPIILIVMIDRYENNQEGNKIYNSKNVKINKFIEIGANVFKLRGIVYHNSDSEIGHSLSIVSKNENIYFINDKKVKINCPKCLNDEILEKKADLLFYEIDDEDEFNSSEFFNIQQFRSTKPRKHKEKEINVEDDESQILFIPNENNDDCFTIPSEISPINNMDHYRTNYIHGSFEKNNLRSHYKNLNGFIQTDFSGCPEGDYDAENPKYEKHAKLFEIFKKAFNGIHFYVKTNVGEVNADIAMESYNIDVDALVPTTVQICGSALVPIFDSYIQNQLPSVEEVRHKVVDCLAEYVQYTFEDMPEDFDENNSLLQLDENYNWKERCIDLNAELIIQHIEDNLNIHKNKKINKNTKTPEERDELKNKIFQDYLKCEHHITSLKNFAKEWVENRKAKKLDTELNYSPEYVEKIIRQGLENGKINETLDRGGGEKKVNKEVIKCLVCTILDFPTASDVERANYLNNYGPCREDNITDRTVNRVLNEYKIKLKYPCFSATQRNTFNGMVLRYLWSRKLKDIASEPDTLLIFIDEASVILGKYKTKARGFYSVIPIVNKPLRNKKMSILAAIIPGFGTCYKWYDSSVKGFHYAKFLREVSYICRSRICNPSTQIIVIHDNCTIHKTIDVLLEAQRSKLNVFSTIPYSPQLNLLAENYFSQLKFYTIFDFTCKPNEVIDHDNINQHHLPAYRIHIMQQWEHMTEIHYDANSTANIYGAWIEVLNLCLKGMPLSGQHIHQTVRYDALILRQKVKGTRKEED